MEERRDISLSKGDVSWEKHLKNYYIDMRPAKVHYTEGVYGGYFDPDGVPMIKTQVGLTYYAINIAQYGFMLLAEYHETPSKQKLELLNHLIRVLENIKKEDETHAIWWHQYDNLRYNIRAPWASAMAQGEIISFYLRMYELSNEKKLLTTAHKAAIFLLNEDHPKRVAVRDKNGFLWLEEYPSSPSSYVLNGFIYALFGLIDLYRINNDAKIKRAIDECFETLAKNIHRFDAGFWSYYDLQKKELVRYYYQKNVHVIQLEILYELTGISVFDEYATKWKNQLTRSNFTFVKIMYRVLPRLRKIFK